MNTKVLRKVSHLLALLHSSQVPLLRPVWAADSHAQWTPSEHHLSWILVSSLMDQHVGNPKARRHNMDMSRKGDCGVLSFVLR